MLSSLLLATPTAPLSPALLDPNVVSCYASATGYDNSPTESTFSFGLPRVLSLVNTTLAQVAHAGSPSGIEASIYQIDLGLKHVRSNSGSGTLVKMVPRLHTEYCGSYADHTTITWLIGASQVHLKRVAPTI